MINTIQTTSRTATTEDGFMTGLKRIVARGFRTAPVRDRATRNWHHRGLDLTELNAEFEKNLSHCRSYW